MSSIVAAEALSRPTQALADFVVNSELTSLSEPVRHAAAQSLLNWVGCAIGASHHETVDIAIAALAPFSGPGVASVLGRSERLDPLTTTFMNGLSSHIFDFDDTDLRTVIHPTGAVASALLAYAEYKHVSGADLVTALVLGIEVECRIGLAVYPAHYDIGWHITGTTGVFGAAAAIGKLLRLDAQRLSWALGLAATQPVGLREMFGSMTKPFHVGRAACNGFTAAILAAQGFTSSEHAIEAKRGWANVLSTNHSYAAITDGLGERYQILHNTFKPFACGIVIHPVIDGCIELYNSEHIAPDDIRSVELHVHHLVLELTGKSEPTTGLEGKFSVYHAAAVSLIEGAGGERQFSDLAVADPSVIALRKRISATIDPAVASDEARITVTLTDGRVIQRHVLHAIGSISRPMTDADLEAKFHGLADDILGVQRAKNLIELCWRVEEIDAASSIASGARL